MDLNSYIQLKEAYCQVGKPQQLAESNDSIWEEVEAFAHALVEEEGLDLSDMTWDDLREAYLAEIPVLKGLYGAIKGLGNTKTPANKVTTPRSRRQNRRSASPAAQANTNSSGQNVKTTPAKPAPTAKAAPAAKPAPTAKPAPAPAAKPAAAKPAPAKSTINDLKSRMPKPAKPSAASAGASAIGAATAKARPTATAIKSNRLRAALDSARKPAPMKEESEFDIILTHLIEQGFGDDEALKLMVNMPEEKRVEILEMRHRDAKTGEVTDKAEVGKIYYPEGPRKKSSVALRKEKEAGEKKKVDEAIDPKGAARAEAAKGKKEETQDEKHKRLMLGKYSPSVKYATRKEEDASLYQAYLSMMSEEGSDKRKDSDLERKGTDARTDYSEPPGAANEWGKKKPMSDKDRGDAMSKIVAKLKEKGGK